MSGNLGPNCKNNLLVLKHSMPVNNCIFYDLAVLLTALIKPQQTCLNCHTEQYTEKLTV